MRGVGQIFPFHDGEHRGPQRPAETERPPQGRAPPTLAFTPVLWSSRVLFHLLFMNQTEV